MAILNQAALTLRAQQLDAKGLNGIEFVLVRLNPVINAVEAFLEVHFFNTHELAAILAAFTGDPTLADSLFPISGGHRIPAGTLTGQVRTVAIAPGPDARSLRLTVQPVGDYSVYTLSVNQPNFDPMFDDIRFKFRPGCFNADCSPPWTNTPRPADNEVTDYLAKDYDSFKHTLIAALGRRIPGWTATSEADLDQVLIDLFSAAGDELSDYQDRVMNEAYLGTARRRVSLARHARLVDYHIHQGSQASTLLAFEIQAGSGIVPAGVRAWTGFETPAADAAVFVSKQPQFAAALLNRIGLYTWSNAAPSLEKGATTADLKLTQSGKGPADQVAAWINDGTVAQLVVEEWLNPATGLATDRDPSKRQLLHLLPNAASVQDPLTSDWMVRINWAPADALAVNYCFTINCSGGIVENVSLFHGNLVPVFHGAPRSTTYRDPDAVLAPGEMHYERTPRWGAICRLPKPLLAYEATPADGITPPKSTLRVHVLTTSGTEEWHERINFIHSDDSEDNGNHFAVETSEDGFSVVRFGNGVNGQELPEDAVVTCDFQVGWGPDGNVGCDTILHCKAPVGPVVTNCWNPFPAAGGLAPEPTASILRRAPEAYRARQLRAVTLQDYVNRAEELPEVQKAAAAYAWTGSWRTVRIAIDPKGGLTLDDELRRKLETHLNAVRLIGEDLELRPPLFVPLEIHVVLCAHADYWREDLRFVLEQTFSSGYTPGGQLAFFHPDRWTFAQALHRSQLEGALLAIEGVEHVIAISMKRWNSHASGSLEQIEVQSNEIIQVLSDPDRMEQGFIDFNIQGGRR